MPAAAARALRSGRASTPHAQNQTIGTRARGQPTPLRRARIRRSGVSLTWPARLQHSLVCRIARPDQAAYVGFPFYRWDRNWPSLPGSSPAGRCSMTTAAPSTALATIQPAFTDPERLALAGYLAGYRGLTREAYALDLRQFTTWCRTASESRRRGRNPDGRRSAEQAPDRPRAASRALYESPARAMSLRPPASLIPRPEREGRRLARFTSPLAPDAARAAR